jgi:hypothetical protein
MLVFDKASIRFVTVRSAQTRQIASRGRASSRHIGTWTRHFPTGLGSPPRSRLPPASDPATNVRRRSLRRMFLPLATPRPRAPTSGPLRRCRSPYRARRLPPAGLPTMPPRALRTSSRSSYSAAPPSAPIPPPGPPYSPLELRYRAPPLSPRVNRRWQPMEVERCWIDLVWAAVARALVEACNIFFPCSLAFHLRPVLTRLGCEEEKEITPAGLMQGRSIVDSAGRKRAKGPYLFVLFLFSPQT